MEDLLLVFCVLMVMASVFVVIMWVMFTRD